jgi:SOS-response transcriptional repressor LexA
MSTPARERPTPRCPHCQQLMPGTAEAVAARVAKDKGLTLLQLRVLTFIIDYERWHYTPPTLDEIGDHLGGRSRVTVFGMIRGLRDKGALDVVPNKSRGIRVKYC